MNVVLSLIFPIPVGNIFRDIRDTKTIHTYKPGNKYKRIPVPLSTPLNSIIAFYPFITYSHHTPPTTLLPPPPPP